MLGAGGGIRCGATTSIPSTVHAKVILTVGQFDVNLVDDLVEGPRLIVVGGGRVVQVTSRSVLSTTANARLKGVGTL